MQAPTEPDTTLSPTKRALLALKEMQSKVEQLERATTEPIAIVGLGCRFPGGDDPSAFWELLRNGGDAIGEVPPDRWDVTAYYDPGPGTTGKIRTRDGGFLDQREHFDASFFRISPREAASLDPQQRLLLEVSWEALEHAAISPEALFGSQTGVFIGMTNFDHGISLLNKVQGKQSDVYFVTGSALNMGAGRLSYLLGLTGPSMVIDTACSSSLVAVHLACHSLRSRECDAALAGGVNIISAPEVSINLSQAGMLAPDGRCKTFDASADGYTRGEGCGIIVLKRLSDALAHGDTILALIRGSAVNQDGPSGGLTVPSGPSQENVIRQALANARLSPGDIQYIEAHGTGTPLGDPIEIGALSQVFGQDTREQPLIVGSVKTNIGHLESAAGIAGIIKVILAMQHGIVPPNLHFNTPNPHIPWQSLPVSVPTTPGPWDTGGKPRIAGISSFGFSGTNAHVILAEPPPPVASGPGRDWQLLTFSAKTEAALGAMTTNLSAWLRQHPQIDLADVAYTGQIGRKAFGERRMLVCRDQAEAVTILDQRNDQQLISASTGKRPPQVVFMLPGLGDHHVNMAVELYRTEPVFQSHVDRCAQMLEPRLGCDLRTLLYPPDQPAAANGSQGLDLRKMLGRGQVEDPRQPLQQTTFAHPALFVIEYALAQLWLSWGIRPQALIGYSVGEYVAACLAGVLSLEDALLLVAERSRLIQSLPAGAMLVVPLSEEELQPWLNEQRSLAAINGPSRCVVAGTPEAIAELEQFLNERQLIGRRLRVAHPFHSALMEPIRPAFRALFDGITLHPPLIPYLSNVSGTWITEAEATDPAYWERQLCQTVRFADGLAALADATERVLLEVGPGQTLCSLAWQYNEDAAPTGWQILPSLRHWYDRESDIPLIVGTAGKLWLAGAEIDWAGFYARQQRRRVHLPTYPFERTRHWVETPAMEFKHERATIVPNLDLEAEQTATRYQLVLDTLRGIFLDVMRIAPERLPANVPFLELGADSIVLLEVIRKIDQALGVTLAIRQLFEELSTLDTLCAYIEQHVAPEWYAAQSAVQSTAPGVTPVAPAPAPQAQAAPSAASPVLQHPPAPAIVQAASQLQPAQLVAMPSSDGAPSAPALLERVLQEQIQAMSRLMSEQLNLLRGTPIEQAAIQVVAQPTIPAPAPPAAQPAPQPQPAAKSVNDLGFAVGETTTLQTRTKTFTPQQQRYLDSLTARYTQRTRRSKAFTQNNRHVWADIRSTLGFRMETKELCYTLVADRSAGARTWDIDGNEYIDVGMGFGVHLFGHNPPFVVSALEQQLKEGMHICPQPKLVGEVSDLISELTGMERVTYCNSGTEAVMTAIRLARAATGRTKIVLFSDAYHGHSDHTLAIARMVNGNRQTIPWVPGVPMSVVGEATVLPYGDPDSLEVIRSLLPELAAVLVEPVQSRRPNLQPVEFLRQLRQMTAEAEVTLIFDEMITGFRIHPGGAQAHFGIRADLATYGKIVGGGMPIGVVAGKARYLDRIDGGMWQYGDDSFPPVVPSFAAGTFCKHPMAMAAAHAVLSRIKQGGPAMLDQISARTQRMADTLDRYFQGEGLGIKVAHFGSLFRFTFANNFSYLYQPLEMDLLFYSLLYRGIYQWEGRTSFLSTAHTDADVDELIRQVQESVVELREGGFFADSSPSSNGHSGNGAAQLPASAATGGAARPAETVASGAPRIAHAFPLTKAQQQLWALAQMGADGQISSKVTGAITIRGPLLTTVLHQAIQTVVDRHETLRSTISRHGDSQQIWSAREQELPLVDLSALSPAERKERLDDWFQAESRRNFDLSAGPLFCTTLIRMEPELHILVWSTHHMIVDGWSITIILREIGLLYTTIRAGRAAPLAPPMQFREYVAWQNRRMQTDAMARSEAYWLQQFAESIPVLNLPTDRPRPPIKTYTGQRFTRRFDAPLGRSLKQASQEYGVTLFMMLMAVYSGLLHQVTGQEEIIFGIPTGGRPLDQGDEIIGYCTNVLPIRSVLPGDSTFIRYVQQIRQTLLDSYEHQDYPFGELLDRLKLRRDPGSSPLVTAIFNLEPRIPLQPAFELEVDLITPFISYTAYDLDLNITEMGDEFVLDIDYNSDLFEKSTIVRLLDTYEALLHEVMRDPHQSIAAIYRSLREQADKAEQQSARQQFKKLRQERLRPGAPGRATS